MIRTSALVALSLLSAPLAFAGGGKPHDRPVPKITQYECTLWTLKFQQQGGNVSYVQDQNLGGVVVGKGQRKEQRGRSYGWIVNYTQEYPQITAFRGGDESFTARGGRDRLELSIAGTEEMVCEAKAVPLLIPKIEWKILPKKKTRYMEYLEMLERSEDMLDDKRIKKMLKEILRKKPRNAHYNLFEQLRATEPEKR